jgi:hypothetical protein
VGFARFRPPLMSDVRARYSTEVIVFAGHIGAAMAIGRAERRVNLGVVVFATMFLDFVLWLLILLGWESATIPANFNTTHQPEFVFPYSHGLLASVGWSVLACSASIKVRRARQSR